MSIRRARLIGLCAVLAAAVVLLGCNLQQTSVGESWRQRSESVRPVVTEGLKHEGYLTVGIRKSAAAPFLTSAVPSPTGLDADVGCALADQMGLSVKFCMVGDVRTALDEEVDVVVGATPDEGGSYEVVGNYADSALSLFRQGDAQIADVKQLDGARIALQDGSSAQMALRITALSITEVPARSLNDAFEMLGTQKADYVCCQAASGGYLTRCHAGVSFAGAISAPTGHGVAIVKGTSAVTSAVRDAYAALEDNGVLASIRQSWVGDLPVLDKTHQIANIPMRETSGDSLESVVGEDEVLGTAQDGSTAGSNAIVGLAGWQSTSEAASNATADSQELGNSVPSYAYEDASQAYDPDYTYVAANTYDSAYDYDAEEQYDSNVGWIDASAGQDADATYDAGGYDDTGSEGEAWAAPAGTGTYAETGTYAVESGGGDYATAENGEAGFESPTTYSDGGNYTESFED